ncbi:I78 family peptidase inhibitor [Simplicispira psychrophila]|uniref:I78 family peptidase inhibitor n=1 Tax=Simplicispira psychrophila TaxID=80882 RepID=UPI0004810B6A|nr:I78 family peptidase inhibitor [Simplicispira psychrophila]
MKLHNARTWMAFLGAALLTGCALSPVGPPPAAQPQWQTPGPRGGACDAAPAQGFLGQAGTASVIEKARIASGAAMARVLHPNQPTTMEFNHERLNLVLDGKGRIAAVRCG